AASVDLAIRELAAPGILGPADRVDWKHIDMSIEHKVPSRLRRVESGDYVGKLLLRSDRAILDALRAEKSSDIGRGFARVARRVRTLDSDEAAKEFDDLVTILLDRCEQRFLNSHLSIPSCYFFRPCRDRRFN